MPEPIAPSAIYARLADASADLAREIERLEPPTARLLLEAVWVHLDDLIEQLHAALAAEAQRQDQEDTSRWQFAVGQHVRRTSVPTQRWEIWYRTCREERDRTWTDYGLRLVDPEADYHPCRMSDGSDLTPAEKR